MLIYKTHTAGYNMWPGNGGVYSYNPRARRGANVEYDQYKDRKFVVEIDYFVN